MNSQKVHRIWLDFSESPPTIFWTPFYVRCITKLLVKEDEKAVKEAHNTCGDCRNERKKDKRRGFSQYSEEKTTGFHKEQEDAL